MTETPQGEPGQPTPPAPQYAQQYPAPGQAYPQQQYPQQPYPGQPASLQYGAPAAPTKTNALALTALIVGIVGLFLCWIPFLGLLVGLVAVVLGFLGMRKSAEVGGKGLAIGGIVAGGIVFLIGLIFTVITLFVVNAANDNLDEIDDFNQELQQQLDDMDTNG